jgi:hypothetical protein
LCHYCLDLLFADQRISYFKEHCKQLLNRFWLNWIDIYFKRESINMQEILIIPITERNQLDAVDPPLRPGDVAHVARCERDKELQPDQIYWVYRIHEDALVGMLFARAVVRQGRNVLALHGGAFVSPDDVVVGGILNSLDRVHV